MSRLGRRPIKLPTGIEAHIDPDSRRAVLKGPKGELSWRHPASLTVTVEDLPSAEKCLKVGLNMSSTADNEIRAIWGLTRSRLHNMVVGVERGFSKNLEIQGVGFKAQLQNKVLVLSLGKSHPITYPIPDGVEVNVDPKQTLITISGIDKEKVGQMASRVRSFYTPEPYKGKGIRYSGERVLRKAGKTAAAGAGGQAKR